MTGFAGLLVLAVVVEGIVGYSNLFFVEKRFQWQVLAAIIIGVLLAVVYSVDIFKLLNMSTKVPYVGEVMTGLIVARGSNYVANLIKLLKNHNDRLSMENSVRRSNMQANK